MKFTVEKAKISKTGYEKSLHTKAEFGDSVLLLALWGLCCFLWEAHWELEKEVPKKCLTSASGPTAIFENFQISSSYFRAYWENWERSVFSYEKEGILSINNLFYEIYNVTVAGSMGNEMHHLCILEMENFHKLCYLPKEECQIWVSTKPMITQAVFNAFSSGKDRCTRTLVITKCQNNIE